MPQAHAHTATGTSQYPQSNPMAKAPANDGVTQNRREAQPFSGIDRDYLVVARGANFSSLAWPIPDTPTRSSTVANGPLLAR